MASEVEAGAKQSPRETGIASRRLATTLDVLIIGAGPAGIAAALELRKIGIDNVIIAERETEAGGIPRMCGHIGFGLSDLHRVMTGPAYARKYREMAGKAGINILTSTTITDWDAAGTAACAR